MSQKRILDLMSAIENHGVDSEPAAEIIRLAAMARTKGLMKSRQWDYLLENGYLQAAERIDLDELAQADIKFVYKGKRGSVSGQQLTPNEYYTLLQSYAITAKDCAPEVTIYYRGKGFVAHAFGQQEKITGEWLADFRAAYTKLWEKFVAPYLEESVEFYGEPANTEGSDEATEEELSESLEETAEESSEETAEDSEGIEEKTSEETTEEPEGEPTEEPEVDPTEEPEGEPTEEKELTPQEKQQAAIAEWEQKERQMLETDLAFVDMYEENLDAKVLRQTGFAGTCFALGPYEDSESPFFITGWEITNLENYSEEEIKDFVAAFKGIYSNAIKFAEDYAKACIAKIQANSQTDAEQPTDGTQPTVETEGQPTTASADTSSDTGTEGASPSGDTDLQAQMNMAAEINARMRKYPVAQWKERLERIMSDTDKARLAAMNLTIDSMFLGITRDMSVAQVVSLFSSLEIEPPAELNDQLAKTTESIAQEIRSEEGNATEAATTTATDN